jgi:hypothetical protein
MKLFAAPVPPSAVISDFIRYELSVEYLIVLTFTIMTLRSETIKYKKLPDTRNFLGLLLIELRTITAEYGAVRTIVKAKGNQIIDATNKTNPPMMLL